MLNLFEYFEWPLSNGFMGLQNQLYASREWVVVREE